MLEIMNGWTDYILQDIEDAEERAKVCGVSKDSVRTDVKAIILAKPLDLAREDAQNVLQRGQWPRFYFTQNGKGGIRRKTYLSNVGGKPPTNYWPYTETGHTDEAKKEMLAIFDGRATFDTPKPERLIEYVLKIAGSKDAIVLDTFAGSGTTAHAVLNMNKADGGNRQFILVEMMDYADSITAERVKRVVQGFGAGKQAVEGTGGNFSYYELGEPLMNGDNLNEEVGIDKIREYVFFTETKCRLPEAHMDEPYYLGEHANNAYYFYYERDAITTLNRDFLRTVKTKADGYVIYADLCTLSEEELERHHITFKKIPRDITKL